MTAVRPQILTTIVSSQPTFPLTLAANLPVAVRGATYAGKLIGVNGAGGYSYVKTAGPAFFTINSATGDCTGTTPTSQASFDVTVTVTDALAATAVHTFHVTTIFPIEPSGGWDPVKTKLPAAITGQPYQFDVSKLLVSPVLPVTYSVTTGSLPTGIAFPTSTNPILTATSVSGSTQSFSVTATDSASNVTIIPLRIEVGAPLSLAVTALPQAIIGHPYYAKLLASGGDGNYSYDVSPVLAQLPSWASLDSKTGEITGTPDALSPTTGVPNIRFRVTDGSDVAAIVNGKVTVGSAVTPAPKGLFLTTASDGSPLAADFLANNFGDGSDGTATIDGTSTLPGCTRSGTIYTATRDLFFTTLTAATGSLVMSGFELYCSVGLDLSNAAANSITASASTSAVTAGAFGGDAAVGAGGTTTNGIAGVSTAGFPGLGGGSNSSLSGAGGAGTSGTGGAAAATGAANTRKYQRTAYPSWLAAVPGTPPFTATQFGGGTGGAGGGGGGGNGSAVGATGGRGGGGGGLLRIHARTVTVSASTAQSAISAVGGDAANGNVGPAAGRGAGGGGAGGPGGAIWLKLLQLIGTAINAWLDASSGKGGNGGASGGAGSTAGNGGFGGEAGSITVIDMLTPAFTTTIVAGVSANSGVTGGAAKINRLAA